MLKLNGFLKEKKNVDFYLKKNLKLVELIQNKFIFIEENVSFFAIYKVGSKFDKNLMIHL